MPTGTLSSSFFIGTLASCLLYGMYYVLFGATLYVLCCKRRTHLNAVLLVASIVICIITTMILALFNSMLYEALIVNDGLVDPTLYLEESYFQWKGTLVFALSMADMIVFDGVLVYRGLAVWSYRWAVLGPSLLLWVFTFGFAIFVIFKNATASIQDIPGLVKLSTYSTIWLSSCLAQNVLTTLLIAYRLWRVDAAAPRHRETRLLPVMWIMIESGALYSAMTLIYTATDIDDVGNIMDALQQIIIPVGGIAYSLIIVRVGLGLTRDSDPYPSSDPNQRMTNVTMSGQPRTQTDWSSLEARSTHSESLRQKEGETGSSVDVIGKAA